IAVVPQRNNLDRSLNALENLTFHAAYFGIGRAERTERARAILDQFGLGQRAKDQVATYSGGMAQRLLIARALMHDPQILFLDEPTTGLDPQSRLFLWDTIRSLNAKGLTILLTTHDMEEAETLCNRVAIMDHGKILALDTPANLSRLVPAGTRVELHTQHSNGDAPNEEVKAAILSKVKQLDGVTSAEWTAAADGSNPSVAAGPPGMFPGGRGAMPDFVAAKLAAQKTAKPKQESMLRLYAQNAGELAVRAAQIVLDGGLELADMHLARPSLEDVFIHLTGRGLRD
ncbi:MAG: ABC transporter ATP-binding protein, partial [Blastocatellia bacterium]